MQQKVGQYISKHQLLAPQDKVIVGLSGGADSVALLHYLSQNGYDCVAAHCNFHLRGEESERDEQFVLDLCRQWNIVLEQIDFETEKIAFERKISIEMAARELRYEWFEQLRIKYQAAAIAVAHHQDDSVETVLLNLIRGTGIRGLTGITPRNGFVVRPFLCVNRSQIERYLDKHQLAFVTDGTNAETIYLRNKIRLELLPWLEEINPSVREAIERTSHNLRSVEQIYLAEIEKQRAKVCRAEHGKTFISIDRLLAFSEPSALLFELLQPFGFNRYVCGEVYASINGISGKTFHSPDYVLVKDRGELIVKQKAENSVNTFRIEKGVAEIQTPISLELNEIAKSDFRPDQNRSVAYFDAAKVAYPLALRRWQQSDWFIPFGMNGKKKLSDYFSDRKFDVLQKEEIWLLCSGDDIIWIVGERSDNRYRVTDETQSILRIELK